MMMELGSRLSADTARSSHACSPACEGINAILCPRTPTTVRHLNFGALSSQLLSHHKGGALLWQGTCGSPALIYLPVVRLIGDEGITSCISQPVSSIMK